ncbi:unnamed protein product [Rhizoctonia solani]|uniref:Uncharacterized protein n=1 Tax=Rhizoctonia solani TaxID=456999 RepID=A0A8H3AHP1_9AGAM|nr:unnamed protein product [Rhizoctonia solani]
MIFLPSVMLFDVRDWVVVVTGSEIEIINPLADILSRSGAHVYVCQPFLSDNDVPGEGQCPGQTYINMEETSKASIANAVRMVETREKHINLLINVNSGDSLSQGKRASWDSFFNRPGSHYADPVSQQTSEVEDWDRVFGTNISSSYFIASAFGSLLRSGAESYGAGCVINISRPGKPLVVGGYTLPTLYGSRLGVRHCIATIKQPPGDRIEPAEPTSDQGKCNCSASTGKSQTPSMLALDVEG